MTSPSSPRSRVPRRRTAPTVLLALLLLVTLPISVLPALAQTSGPPRAQASTDAEGDAQIDQPITFDGSGSENAITHVWSFPDGTTAEGAIVEHQFALGGLHRVYLTVRDGVGRSHRTSVEVPVAPYHQAVATERIDIPTRHGTMRATLTRPAAVPGEEPGAWPTIIEYGPYESGFAAGFMRTTVQSGYAFVKVSAPGRDRSDGVFDFFGAVTGEAGYDAVEWVAEQPWSTGRTALIGMSGPAVAAMAVLKEQPPSLTTAAISLAPSDLYRDYAHIGGVTSSNAGLNAWNALFAAEPFVFAHDATDPPWRWQDQPMREVAVAQTAADFNGRPFDDEYWAERRYVDEPASVPVLYLGSHRDIWPRSAPEIFRWAEPAGGRVIMLYSGHWWTDPTGYKYVESYGDAAHGFPGSATGDMRAWLDHHLRDVDNGIDAQPPLQVLVPRGADWGARQGAAWLGLEGWPDPSTSWTSLLLDGLDPITGRGGLAEAPPSRTEPDLALGGAGWRLTADQDDLDDAQQLVYETPVLTEDLTVAGPVTLDLRATLTGADMAWTVLLEEVRPDGSTALVGDGALQASHRALDESRTRRNSDGEVIQPWRTHSVESFAPVIPGEPTQFHVEIPTVFTTFTQGSRIRLVVVGSDARNVDDSEFLGTHNHQTAPQSAAFEVLHDADNPSRLLLPVLPDPAALALPLPTSGW